MRNWPKLMTHSPENDRKLSKTPILETKCWIIWIHIFFSKIGLRHFYTLATSELPAKKLRNPMAGSMRTFVADWLTDRQTDGSNFKGPKCWSNNNNNCTPIFLLWGMFSLPLRSKLSPKPRTYHFIIVWLVDKMLVCEPQNAGLSPRKNKFTTENLRPDDLI